MVTKNKVLRRKRPASASGSDKGTTEAVSFQKIPAHVAIIMDGNGRWAKKRLKPRVFGHKAGLKAVRRAIDASNKYGVKILTLFAFSSENWNRPKDEVNYLMSLFIQTLETELNELHEKNIRLNILGDISGLNKKLADQVLQAQEITRNNDALILNLAINYGGRWDIAQACRKIAHQVGNGQLRVEDIDESVINRSLTTKGMPDPDLLIRTSNEMRISNFLLWQCAYSEFFYTDKFWPDFDESVFYEALAHYNRRERRFGMTGDQLQKDSAELEKDHLNE